MLAVFFLLSAGAFGTSLACLIPTGFRLEERLAIGAVIGLAVSTLLGFVLSWVFNLSPTLVGIESMALLAAALALSRRQRVRLTLSSEWRELKARLDTTEFWIMAAVFFIFTMLLFLIFKHALFIEDGTLFAGFGNVWGDWNQHLSQTTSFAYSDNFPPELYTLSGHRLSYPFLTNFLSAIMIKGGLPLATAMWLPVFLLATISLALLMSFTRIIVGTTAAMLVPFLFFLSGGLGFINFFDDWAKSGLTFFEFIGHQPHTYTQAGEGVIKNINFINTIYAYVVPQRAFIFGLPLVLSMLTVLYRALESRDRRLFFAAGSIGILLPLVHTYGLMFIAFAFPLLVLLTRKHLAGRRKPRWKDLAIWLYFIAPLLLVALPIMLWLTQGVDSSKFFRFQFGWIKGDDDIFWFWLKNLGAYLPLVIAGLIVMRNRMRLSATFVVSFSTAFLLANLFIFQPWDWDNTKLFVYWYVANLPIVAFSLVWLWKNSVLRPLVVGLFLVLTMAGSADVAKALAYNTSKVQMFDPTGQEIGTAVRTQTPEDSVFLTSQIANNPFASLGGRRIVLGYAGWFWSYGLDYLPREADVVSMYEARQNVEELLNRYGVDYIVIGPSERSDKGYRVNEHYYQSRYAVWRTFGQVTVYDRSEPLLSP